MSLFTVNWTISGRDERGRISKLKLNDEWSLVGVWSGIGAGLFRPDSIEIRRKITAGNVSISGSFSLQQNNRPISGQEEFSKVLKSGSSFVNLVHFRVLRAPRVIGTSQDYFLHGFVNITSSEKCSSEFENGDSKISAQPTALSQLSLDLERLLDPHISSFADVTLKCGSESMPAHKNILSARSPVFAAMFSNPMLENTESEVNIADMDASVLRAMLTYVYSGKTSDLTISLATDLLFAADKYQLLDLKKACCDFLKNNTSLQNVLCILVLGDMYAEDLRSFAVSYICNSCSKFSVLEETEEWNTLKRERPILAIDILTSVVKSREEKL